MRGDPEVGAQRAALPPWRRLAVRLAVAFAVLTFLSVAIVGVLVRERQKRELEDAVGTQLLNIARVAVLLVDPAQHTEVPRAPRSDSPGYADPARESGDVYGKVTGAVERDGMRLTRIHLTSVDPGDRAVIEGVLAAAAAPAAPRAVSNAVEEPR